METIILIAIIGIMNIFCFIAGAIVGQKSVRNETIELPSPVKVVTEYKETRERKEEQEKINTMLDNINNYDGTGLGQKDI